jgi:hypothetical protein
MIDGNRRRWLLALAATLVAVAIAVVLGLRTRDTGHTAKRPGLQERSTSYPPGNGRSRSAPLQPPRRWAWPLEAAMQRIDGARITAAGRVIRIDSATTLCSGLGRPVVRGGVVRWHSFDCTFTTFRHGIDQDVEFHLSLLGTKRYAISAARWIGEQR